MGKSPAYKRKLRRSQKLKKRQKLREYKLLHGNGAHQGSAELERKAPVGENGLCEEFSASGSNNGLQVDSASHKESAELESGPEAPVGATSACEELGASVSENESSSNNGLQANNLRKELAKANKHIQYYRNKIEKQEMLWKRPALSEYNSFVISGEIKYIRKKVELEKFSRKRCNTDY